MVLLMATDIVKKRKLFLKTRDSKPKVKCLQSALRAIRPSCEGMCLDDDASKCRLYTGLWILQLPQGGLVIVLKERSNWWNSNIVGGGTPRCLNEINSALLFSFCLREEYFESVVEVVLWYGHFCFSLNFSWKKIVNEWNIIGIFYQSIIIYFVKYFVVFIYLLSWWICFYTISRYLSMFIRDKIQIKYVPYKYFAWFWYWVHVPHWYLNLLSARHFK